MMQFSAGSKTILERFLSSTQTAAARGQRLSQLQGLLPSVDASAKEAVSQVDLAAQGLRIPGFPTIIGPFGYTDIRASLSWSLVDLHALRTYLAARHNFNAAQLTAQDARDLVVLTVGKCLISPSRKLRWTRASLSCAKTRVVELLQKIGLSQ